MDRLVLDLVERLMRTSDFSEACSMALEAAALQQGIDRALVVFRSGEEVRAAGWGVAQDTVSACMSAFCEPGSPLAAALSCSEPVLFAHGEVPAPLSFGSCAALPFAAGEEYSGTIVLEVDRLDERAGSVTQLFQRCAPTLGRALLYELVQDRADRISRERDVLAGIVNGLPDPILLTDARNDILLANRRAEELFSADDSDSEGRRRAVQINNLLFTSFLTQALIGRRAGGRELNLVDPSDGSDLLFEMLPIPLPPGAAGDGSMLSVLRDITDLKRAVTEMESQMARSRAADHHAHRERDRLTVILENVGDPILMTDHQSNILLMNREAEHLLDVPADTRPNTPARRAVRANDTKFTSLISDFLLQPAVRRLHKLDLTDPANGQEFPVEVISSKILDARGEPTAIVSVLHDLTQVAENERLARELQQLNDELEERVQRATEELEHHNQRLEWQSRELEEASRLKSEFLASMSHELRTPINVLLGYVALMRDGIYGELTGAQESALEKVQTATKHLLELISDILDLSKIEAGRMPVHIEEVDIESIIRELTETVAPLVREKSLTLATQVEAGIPVLYTDGTKVKQVLLNLLSNAIKFTPHGTISVGIDRVGEEGRIRLTVADTGIGIRPEHLEAIFDDFRQVDQSSTREYGGTGLGLSITRKLLSLLGGSIFVESVHGEGSTFIVDLPFVTDAGMVDEQVRRPLVASEQPVVEPAEE